MASAANNQVVSTTSEKYTDSFGFTEEEVFAVLDEFGLSDQKQLVKDWYDGFMFGEWKEDYESFGSRAGTLLSWLCAGADGGACGKGDTGRTYPKVRVCLLRKESADWQRGIGVH